MSIRGLNLFNNANIKNNPYLMQNLGHTPIPMRGLERFMQKRGMNYPIYPQGGNFQGSNFGVPNYPGGNPQGEGRLTNTLNVQEPTEKRGGIKEFFSRFSRKKNH